MMRSLFSGVSGLKVHQTKMDVIGNNIANVNTVGYKSQSVTFTDILYQTTQSASGPNSETGAGGVNAKQIGLGSSLGAISTNITASGGSQRTDNPFDLMINGDSFFIVNKGGTNYFTKAGNFTVDESGTLVTSSGNQVMGWQADTDGKIIADRVSSLQIMSEDKQTTPPEATSASTIAGNINKNSDKFNNDPPNNHETMTVKFYDSLGYSYDAIYHINRTDTEGQYTMSLYSLSQAGTTYYKAPLVSDTDPSQGYNYDANLTQQLNFNITGGADAAGNGSGALVNVGTAGVNKSFTLDLNTITANQQDAGGNNLTMPASFAAQTITVDCSSVTNYGSKTTIDSQPGDKEGAGKGKAVGTMNKIGIQVDGKIVASYSNGDTRTLGQIVVTDFSNPSGLEKVGDNLYAQTLNSGEFNGIGADITASGETFTSGVLEMSNVDLSSEFTEMITTQRGFQANSRIITTSDTMLEELINLKR